MAGSRGHKVKVYSQGRTSNLQLQDGRRASTDLGRRARHRWWNYSSCFEEGIFHSIIRMRRFENPAPLEAGETTADSTDQAFVDLRALRI